MVFSAPGGRWYHAPRSEGGWGTIQTRNAAKPLSFISLISLCLSTMNRPAPLRTREKGWDESAPPQNGGSCDPDSGTEGHTAIPAPWGSLSSSFIPAGRLRTAPRSGAEKPPLLQSLLQPRPFPSPWMIPDRSSPSRVRFAASRPGLLRAVWDGPKGPLSVIPAALSRSRGALSPAGP